jgi:hypothetical protein
VWQGARSSMVSIYTLSNQSTKRLGGPKDLEEQLAEALVARDQPVKNIEPNLISCGTIVVHWYSMSTRGTGPSRKKRSSRLPSSTSSWGSSSPCLSLYLDNVGANQMQSSSIYTFTLYLGSSVHVPIIEGVMHALPCGYANLLAWSICLASAGRLGSLRKPD